MMSKISFDPVWNAIYDSGAMPRAPYDYIASFVFRNADKTKTRNQLNILEIGCGGGNNLWFLALEGFNVFGIDGSASAIDAAKKRLSESGLSGDLRVGDFTNLPFDNASFDLVFDRGALTCCGTKFMKRAIHEAHRVLKPGGAFFFNPIADSDTSYRSGKQIADDLTIDIKEGDYNGVGQIRFVSRREIDDFMPEGMWNKKRIERVEITDMLNSYSKVVASWRIEAIKVDNDECF